MYCEVTVKLKVNCDTRDEAETQVARIISAITCPTMDGDDPEIYDFEIVQVGDLLAQDESAPILQVKEVFENQQVMFLELGCWSIETTPGHPFWVREKGWTPAGDIEPGDELQVHGGQWIPLDSSRLISYKVCPSIIIRRKP